jgi:dihydrofolate reductase
MAKVLVVNHVTLDGVMQAPAGPDEDTRGGFAYGGWSIPGSDQVMAAKMAEMMAKGDRDEGGLLLGRRTYESFYAYWPHQTDNPYTERLNHTTKYVASRTLQEPLPWSGSVLLDGDAGEAVAALKEGLTGDLTILGSGELIGALMAAGLIDELLLMIHPLVLGTGRRLFPEGVHASLRLTESITTTTGVVIATYDRAMDLNGAHDEAVPAQHLSA